MSLAYPICACLPERIESKIAYEAMTGCWLWTGATSTQRDGSLRGQVRFEGKPQWAYRVIWFLTYGTRPRLLRHLCATPLCVQPLHLRAGTNRENLLDWDVKTTGSLTHCRHGHERAIFDVVRAGRDKTAGKVYCRECASLRMKEVRKRKRAMA
jgi:hypothetical protein